jgi:hypothetical protein
MDKEAIIKSLFSNFVLKEKRERSFLKLTSPKRRGAFIDKFNHNWDVMLNMDYLEKLSKKNDYPDKIQKSLQWKDNDICYVISHYSEADDKIIASKEAFSQIYGRGLASIIINLTATKLYLETEQIQGPPSRFIGRRNK